MTGGQRRSNPMQGQHTQDGDAHREDGRLGVLRHLEVFFRPLKDQLCDREANGLVGLGEGFAGNGKTIGKFAAHANGLRALPWKKKG